MENATIMNSDHNICISSLIMDIYSRKDIITRVVLSLTLQNNDEAIKLYNALGECKNINELYCYVNINRLHGIKYTVPIPLYIKLIQKLPMLKAVYIPYVDKLWIGIISSSLQKIPGIRTIIVDFYDREFEIILNNNRNIRNVEIVGDNSQVTPYIMVRMRKIIDHNRSIHNDCVAVALNILTCYKLGEPSKITSHKGVLRHIARLIYCMKFQHLSRINPKN